MIIPHINRQFFTQKLPPEKKLEMAIWYLRKLFIALSILYFSHEIYWRIFFENNPIWIKKMFNAVRERVWLFYFKIFSFWLYLSLISLKILPSWDLWVRSQDKYFDRKFFGLENSSQNQGEDTSNFMLLAVLEICQSWKFPHLDQNSESIFLLLYQKNSRF